MKVAGVPASSTNSAGYRAMQLTLETEQETDGRWLAEVPELAGVMAYGPTRAAAMAKAEALAFRVLAERLEHDEADPMPISFSLAAE
jgi:predicted RNase H-like HicB family nuclease